MQLKGDITVISQSEWIFLSFRGLISLLRDEDAEVAHAALTALPASVSSLSVNGELPVHLIEGLLGAVESALQQAGCCLPAMKCLAALSASSLSLVSELSSIFCSLAGVAVT